MSRHGEFVALVIEQMALFGCPYVRAMFGGYGLYRDDCIFAIIADDRLYFKADAVTRLAFEAKGLRPFTYVAGAKRVSLHYFEAPPEVFEDPEVMQVWAQQAYAVALRSKKVKRVSRRQTRE